MVGGAVAPSPPRLAGQGDVGVLNDYYSNGIDQGRVITGVAQGVCRVEPMSFTTRPLTEH
jgi:hypothetical protein